jgi:hypothetical protein
MTQSLSLIWVLVMVLNFMQTGDACVGRLSGQPVSWWFLQSFPDMSSAADGHQVPAYSKSQGCDNSPLDQVPNPPPPPFRIKYLGS